jgi:signal-transduction protein with cAMP-binding, CBS, and nucleotidyltransferase domain
MLIWFAIKPAVSAMTVSCTISSILQDKGAQVWAISPEATVFEAIELMAEKNVGALLVMSGERLLGMMTERDYTRKVALHGKNSKETRVREIISSSYISVTPFHTVEDCMHLMTNHRVRHLPVLEGDRVTGIVSIGDLVNWTINAQHEAIHQLESYIAGQYPG